MKKVYERVNFNIIPFCDVLLLSTFGVEEVKDNCKMDGFTFRYTGENK